MKISLLISFVIFSQFIQSQDLPDNFKIGDYIEVFENDSILVYFNCTGTIVKKECAQFVRKGKIDSINCNVSGIFYDYDLDSNLFLKAKMVNDFLNGKATYYHKNGKIRATGKYLDNIKNGVWTFFYPNGNLEKVLNFVNGSPLIVAYYNEKGEQIVINGTGKYKGIFCPYMGCKPFIVKGKVLNGKMEGKWKLVNTISATYDFFFEELYVSNSNQVIGTEVFKDGKFIKGYSGGYSYTNSQKIQINGYYVNEDLILYGNQTSCPGDQRFYFLHYQESLLEEKFYPQLINSISESINCELKNQWLIVGLNVTKEGKLDKLNIKSSINDNKLEKQISLIISEMKGWNPETKNNNSVDSDLFFSIIISNKQVIIPKEYIHRNQ